jgi:hypothetical protein
MARTLGSTPISKRKPTSKGKAKKAGKAPAATKALPPAQSTRSRRRRPASPASPAAGDDDGTETEDVDTDMEDGPGEVETVADQPLSSMTLEQIKIRQIQRQMEREDELHTVKMAAAAGLTSSKTQSTGMADITEDDYGESSLSPFQREKLLLFPGIPKKDVIAILKGTFSPMNLPNLDRNVATDRESEFTLSLEGGQLKSKKTIGKHSAFGTTPKLWSRTFLTYMSIVVSCFGAQFPALVVKLVVFHQKVIKLSETYKWQGAVLNMAIEWHERQASTGITDTAAWDLTPSFIDEWTRGHQLGQPSTKSPSNPSNSSARSKEPNTPGRLCRNYNKPQGCTFEGCRRDHECETCGEKHPGYKHTDKKKATARKE